MEKNFCENSSSPISRARIKAIESVTQPRGLEGNAERNARVMKKVKSAKKDEVSEFIPIRKIINRAYGTRQVSAICKDNNGNTKNKK